MSTHLAIFITAKDMQEAEHIARHLLQEHLAACVNIVPTVHSHYWWEGKIEQSQECLLIVKTLRERLGSLVERVKQLHSYTVPEVIAMEIAGGNADYLGWVQKESSQLNWTQGDYLILDVEDSPAPAQAALAHQDAREDLPDAEFTLDI